MVYQCRSCEISVDLVHSQLCCIKIRVCIFSVFFHGAELMINQAFDQNLTKSNQSRGMCHTYIYY